jgi:hypothetical protein
MGDLMGEFHFKSSGFLIASIVLPRKLEYIIVDDIPFWGYIFTYAMAACNQQKSAKAGRCLALWG